MHQFLLGKGPVATLFSEGFGSTSDGMYGTVVFSPDQTEAFWAKDKHPGLFFSRMVDGAWTTPGEFLFAAGYRLSSPFYSADGNQLYFMVAGRDEAGMDMEEQIWVVDRLCRRGREEAVENHDIRSSPPEPR